MDFNETGVVKAICISPARGTEKHTIPEGHFIPDFGIEGDAHAGTWHRQVSLLSYNKVEEFNKRGANVGDGAFGENLVVDGIDFRALPVGTRLYAGTVELRMTQIGKECHSHCAIYHRVGECIMPREGVFAEVIKEGIIRPGDVMRVEAPDENRPFTAAVIVLSDKGSRGEREDASGPAAEELLKEAGYDVVERFVIPDEPAGVKASPDPSGRQPAGGSGGHQRRHWLFHAGSDTGGNAGRGRPERAGNRGVHPHEVHADHGPGHVKPWCIGHSKERP